MWQEEDLPKKKDMAELWSLQDQLFLAVLKLTVGDSSRYSKEIKIF